jgi:hypothetical protein
MRITRVPVQHLALCAALAAALASPASAQVSTADARPFLGNWVMSITSDMGQMNLQLNIRDNSGQVAAQFGSPELGALQEVPDISKAGEQLHLALFIDAQGQQIDVSMAVTPDGDGLNVDLSAAGGAFTTSARATRAT